MPISMHVLTAWLQFAHNIHQSSDSLVAAAGADTTAAAAAHAAAVISAATTGRSKDTCTCTLFSVTYPIAPKQVMLDILSMSSFAKFLCVHVLALTPV